MPATSAGMTERVVRLDRKTLSSRDRGLSANELEIFGARAVVGIARTLGAIGEMPAIISAILEGTVADPVVNGAREGVFSGAMVDWAGVGHRCGHVARRERGGRET